MTSSGVMRETVPHQPKTSSFDASGRDNTCDNVNPARSVQSVHQTGRFGRSGRPRS
jgi:hypothetical protein